MGPKIHISNFDDILCRYQAGESENKLASELGVSRQVVRRHLLESGIQPRGRSEAELIKWQRMTPEQRDRQVAAAHIAARGRTVSWEEKCRRAKALEGYDYLIVPVETELAEFLRSRGLDVTQQKAVGAYNIDVAINLPTVAVEVFGGQWHTCAEHKTRHYKRVKYLLNEGWHVLIIWVDARRYPISVGAHKYIISFTEELRRNPPALSEYRVILGNGEDAPIASSYLNTPADIKRLRGST